MSESGGKEIKPGHWYLCAICQSCAGPIPILEIVPNATIGGNMEYLFPGVPCPHCGTKGDYRIGSMRRLQAQQTGRLQ